MLPSGASSICACESSIPDPRTSTIRQPVPWGRWQLPAVIHTIDTDGERETGVATHEGAGMYPEIMVIPMREELTRAGIQEARTAAEVDAALAKPGTTMVVVNSICGCAAGKMRPGVRLAMQNATLPDQSITVFAGQDREATERARSYFEGNPPTSPAIAILRDGKLVYLMQRFVIEQATAQQIAGELIRAFDEFCAKTTA